MKKIFTLRNNHNKRSDTRRGGSIQAFLLITMLVSSAFLTIAPLTFLHYNLAFANNNSASSTTTTSTNNNDTNINNCKLNSAKGNIQHVIYIQFDNTHFTRDNPNVPSDLEQMPHLLGFINSTGILYTNHHTSLIAHTATNFLTSITGLYPDHMGVPVSNSFKYFKPDGSIANASYLAYWTSPLYDTNSKTASTRILPTDTKFNMLTANGKNAPAPWVPYTRAGCNFGAVAMANTVIENTATDIPRIFGQNSTQVAEANSNPSQASSDLVGIAVHCAINSKICSASNGGRPDLLPDEPGNYSGFMGLFGHKYVGPQITPSSALPMRDLDGNIIENTSQHIGFPGFDSISASVSLSYVTSMQEHGIPITYAYIEDAHDAHPTGLAYGPGKPAYVAALKAYDGAFAKFFARLQHDGITSKNTLCLLQMKETTL